MTASDLSEWVGLFMMELTPDGQGGYREKVPDDLVPDTPANVRIMTGTEVSAADQIAQRVRYAVTIRYEPGITPAYRVLWGELLLDVFAVENVDTADEWLELQCGQKEAGAQ